MFISADTLKKKANSINFDVEDQDLSVLFKDSSRNIVTLNLSNNLLTTDCLDNIMKFPKLRVLNLSNNPLGPSILQKLPELLLKVPYIEEINLANTHLGEDCFIDTSTRELYTAYQMAEHMESNLILNISHNHFKQDTLWHWTNLFRNLVRVRSLQLSSVTSDTTWNNFDTLLEIPK